MFEHKGTGERPLAPTPPCCRICAAQRSVRNMLESKLTQAFMLLLITLDASCVVSVLSWHVLNSDGDSPEWVFELVFTSRMLSCIFLLEISLLIFGSEPGYYGIEKPRHKLWGFHVFDLVLVYTMAVLWFVLHGRVAVLAHLLVFLRFWRVIKFIDVVVRKDTDELAQETISNLEAKNAELGSALATSQKKVDNLRLQVLLATTAGTAGGENVELGLIEFRSLPGIEPVVYSGERSLV